MRVTRFGAMALGFATLLFTMTMFGCAGGGTEKDKVSDTGGKDKGDVTQAKKTGLKPGKGTFKGKVTFVGDKPDIAKLNEELKAQMDKASATDKPHCLEGPKEQTEQQDWKIGADNGVAEVFVYFKPVKDTFFEFDKSDDAVKAAADHNPTIDQPHCAFTPHVLTAFPSYRDAKNKSVKTEQKLIVKNSSAIGHNTKIEDGSNLTIPSKDTKTEEVTPHAKPVMISCGVHPWMNAYLLSLEHPYAAITNAKGEFEIKNVPKGKVQVVVYHPKSGYVTQGKEIDLKEDGATESFEIKAK